MNTSRIYCLPFIITLSIIVLIQCEKTQYQYYESGKIRVKEIKSHVNSTKYYYDENGKTIVEKVSNKNGSYIKRHFDDSGKIDNEQESDLHGIITERRYSIDGIIEVENVSDEAGLLLWRDYSAKGILISEERYLNDKKHGVCSKFYCQDGSLKNQCTFKNGEPYNGIWSIDCEWMSFYYKYINGKKEKIEFNFKEFPYDFSRSYNITLLNDSCFHLGLKVNISTTTCEGHENGSVVLKRAKIAGYDSSSIKIIDSLKFKVFSPEKSWILFQGITNEDSLYLDSICITNDSAGIHLKSRYSVIPGVGSEYNFRTLSNTVFLK